MFKLYFNSILLVGVFTTGILAVIVYSRQKKDIANKIWFTTSICASLWSVFYFFTINAVNREIALILIKVVNIFGLLIILSWIYFVMVFLEIYKQPKFRKIFLIILLIGIGISILSFTPFFIKDMVPKYIFNYYVEPGIGYYIYTTYFFLIIVYGLYLLAKLRKNFLGVKETQIKYIIIASMMGFIGGCSVFLLALNIFFPPYPLFLFAAFPLAIAYAINKHHLFNIRIITTELFTLAIWIALLARILLSNNIQDAVINIIIFLSVIFFGILLIRSVTKEVKQREKIEELAMRVQQAYEVEKQAHAAETRNRERAEELAKDAQRLDAAKTQFIMATQHHLRTPLTAMMGYMDLLMTGSYGKIPKKINEVLQKFEKSTKNEIKIVNDLLDVSQFQLGKKVAFLQKDIDLEPIIKDIMEDVVFEANAKKIKLEFEKPIKLPLIKADPEKLKVALTNLLDNAIKYTNQGEVRIKCEATDGKVKIIIKDTGLGLSQEEIPKLFSRVFERSEEAQRTFATGRGIGLYITSQIIKEHGGRVWAESEGKGKGSVFFVELPVA